MKLIRIPGHLPKPVGSGSPEHGKTPQEVYGRVQFLGYTVTTNKRPRLKPAPESVRRAKERIRQLTRSGRGRSIRRVIEDINLFTRGWVGYYRMAEVKQSFDTMDQWIRDRLRNGVNSNVSRPDMTRQRLRECRLPTAAWGRVARCPRTSGRTSSPTRYASSRCGVPASTKEPTPICKKRSSHSAACSLARDAKVELGAVLHAALGRSHCHAPEAGHEEVDLVDAEAFLSMPCSPGSRCRSNRFRKFDRPR